MNLNRNMALLTPALSRRPGGVVIVARRKVAVAILAIMGMAMLPAIRADAPFEANVRVDDGGTSAAVFPALTASGGTLYAAFEDYRFGSGDADVRFTKSTDGGQTWSPSVRVHEALSTDQFEPAIGVDTIGGIYVAWSDLRNSPAWAFDTDIYVARSTDGGATWSAGVRASDGPSMMAEREPTIAVGAGGAFVAYRDIDIRATTSYPIGGDFAFNPTVRVNDDTGTADQTQPSITLGETDAYLAWKDMRNGGQIYTSRYTSYWHPNVPASGSVPSPGISGPSILPGTALGEVNLAYSSEAAIRFTKSQNFGDSWFPSWPISDPGNGPMFLPTLSKDGNGTLQVAWEDWRIPGNTEIFATKSLDGGWTWEANRRVNDDVGTADQEAPASAFLGDVFHVVFADARNGDWDVYTAKRVPGATIPKPDLSIVNADVTVSPGFGSSYVSTAQTLSAVVRNLGTYLVVKDFAVGFYRGDMDANDDGVIDAGAVLLKSVTVPASWANPIPVGGSRVASASWTPATGDVGTFTIHVAVDLQASGPFTDAAVDELDTPGSEILNNEAFYDTGLYASGPEPPYRTAAAPNYRVHNALADVVVNGKFQTGTSGWTFTALGKNKPTGSWDSAGYQNGGAAKTASPVGSKKTGEGYWQQGLGTIQAGSIVKLSYDWKKGVAGLEPTVQDIRIVLVKPGGATVNLDVQLGAPGAYNTWYLVTDKLVSSNFDQTGTYSLRLQYAYKTGASGSSQAIAWFDEVKVLVSAP
jgi:hypothetical protein